MITSSVDHPAHQDLVERYECMDCGHVGPAADLRSHAAQDGCRNFRTTTTRVSSTGRILDELVEVCQLSDAGARQRAPGAGKSQDLRHARGHE